MKLRTSIRVTPFPRSIRYGDRLLSVGSCFSEHMGRILGEYKFDIVSNPHGIVYNPYSLFTDIDRLLAGHPPPESGIFEKGGLWKTLYAHSSIYAYGRLELTGLLQGIAHRMQARLRQADWILLTFGTAYIWKYTRDDQIVANCHQLPSRLFRRERLDVGEIVERGSATIESMSRVNPDAHWILTVSPVRHLRDGMVENNRSKSVLLLATERLSRAFPNVFYFPSYEIVMDDLRDYRFYERDLLHPSTTAVDYIFDIFSNSLFDGETREQMKRVGKLIRSFAHRPLHPGSKEFRAFAQDLIAGAEKTEGEIPGVSFRREVDRLRKDLAGDQ